MAGMNSAIDDDERRRFHRVLFDAPAKILTEDDEFISPLVDLSLNGALLVRPDNWQIDIGHKVQLTVLLDDSEARIQMEAEVAHLETDSLGLRCLAIDMESITHLRRLVELNLGDTELLERDLEALG